MRKQVFSALISVVVGCASDASSSAVGETAAPSQPASMAGSGEPGAAGGGDSGAASPGSATASSNPGAAAAGARALPVGGAGASAGAAAAAAGTNAPKAAGSGAAPRAGFELLMSGEWTLEPGGESTRTCFKKTLTEDTFIAAIRPVSPPGTHHSLLSMGEDPASDCTESVAEGLIYAAAAGTDGLVMPEGVAIKLPAGHTLKLGLHLFNVTDVPLTGISGLEVVTLPASEVKHESQAVLVGPAPFLLAPKATQKLKSTCTLKQPQTVFAVFPHMHEYGRHITTSAVIGGAAKVIHDSAFEFAEQRQYPLAPFTLNANDTVTTECTFENTTDAFVEFGESTTTEMCLSVLFAYPPVGTGLCLGLPE